MSNGLVEAAGCVVCRITPKDKTRVLLVHGTKSEPDYYGFPKGHRDPGESIELTAIREVKEETGLIVELISLVGLSQYIVFDQGVEQLKMVRYYLARPVGGSLEHGDDEHDEVLWASIKKARNLLTYKADVQTLRVAKKYIKTSDLYRTLLYESATKP